MVYRIDFIALTLIQKWTAKSDSCKIISLTPQLKIDAFEIVGD